MHVYVSDNVDCEYKNNDSDTMMHLYPGLSAREFQRPSWIDAECKQHADKQQQY